MHEILTDSRKPRTMFSAFKTLLCLLTFLIFSSPFLFAQSGNTCTINTSKTTICKGENILLTPNCSGTSFLWSNGKTTKQINVKPDATTLYSVTCTASNGSIKTGNITINVTPLPTAVIIAASQSCPNVVIPISAENAGNGATYSWDFGGSATPRIATGIGAHQVAFSLCTPRTITLTVSKDGCTNTKQKTIKGDETAPVLYGVPNDMTVTSLPLTPKDNCDKDVAVIFTETYTVNGCNRIGICKWTATDKCGNTATATMRLTITTLFTLFAEVTSNYFPYSGYPSGTGTQISKLGASDGKAKATIVSGGVEPFTYKWSNGETTQEALNLSAGRHLVTVTDANGCSGTTSVTIKSPAKIGDYIFLDNNINGIQDSPDVPLVNAKITLIGTDVNGAAVNFSTTSANNGKYCFDGLIPGTYKIKVEAPLNSNIAPTLKDQGTNDDLDSDIGIDGCSATISVTNGQNIKNLDAGFCPAGNAQLGDYVWLDRNGNGIQDPTETTGIANVTVTLTGTTNRTTTTDANGKYLFTGLSAGNYTLTFSLPSTYLLSPKDKGTDDALDSDAESITAQITNIILAAGEINLKNDVGVYKVASLGDFVWEDTNKNGIQDIGENGIPNITVLLDGTTNDGIAFIQRSTATSATGNYTFYTLKPGVYQVSFVKAIGYVASPANQGGDNLKDSDANINTGKTGNITLNSNSNNTSVDAGFYKEEGHTCVIGDYVWLDCNKNGIQDFGEFGVPNALVQLKKQDGTIAAVTTTAINGFYNFNNIPAGTYTLCFFFPSSPIGLAFSPKKQGTDISVDSDVNPNGSTDPIIITTQIVNTIDAGMMDILAPSFANIPVDVTVECDNIPPVATNITATDNLDRNVTIDFIESRTSGICTYKIIRTWTGYDDCGNKCAHSQTITVIDSKAPVLVAPADLTLSCNDILPLPVALTATDNCDPNPQVTYLGETTGIVNNKLAIKRTWQATDRCGNSSKVTQHIYQTDSTAPTFENVPADATVECNQVPLPKNPDVKDNCSPLGITVKFKETRTDGDCLDRYSLKREWTACDLAGNSNTATQLIVVQDNTPPVISGAPTVDVTINCGDPVPLAPEVTASDNCDVTLTKPSFSELIFQGNCSTIVGGQSVITNHIRCQWLASDRCGNTVIKVWNIYIVDDNNGKGAISKMAQKDHSLKPIFKENVEKISPNQTIIAYPNPTHGLIQLDIKEQLVKEIHVTDITGKIVYFENQIRGEQTTIDLSMYQLGIYTLRLKMQDGKWNTQKIILIQ
jgi:hypothetical protein